MKVKKEGKLVDEQKWDWWKIPLMAGY